MIEKKKIVLDHYISLNNNFHEVSGHVTYDMIVIKFYWCYQGLPNASYCQAISFVKYIWHIPDLSFCQQFSHLMSQPVNCSEMWLQFCDCNFFLLILIDRYLDYCSYIVHTQTGHGAAVEKLTLVQVMSRCHQVTEHFLKQWLTKFHHFRDAFIWHHQRAIS